MTWLAVVIIITVICLSLVIFAPRDKTFLDKETYPHLDILSDPMHLQLIKNDLCRIRDDEFLDYPDEKMWKFNKTSKYKIFPFYMFGQFSQKNIEICPDTFQIAHNIPYIRSMAFIKIGAKSVLKVHQNWKHISNETFRCLLGVEVPSNDVNACGVWIKGHTKKLEDGKWIVFDSSRLHSIYNKQSRDCHLLMFDLKRPGLTMGVSEQPLPDGLESFIEKFADLETVKDQDSDSSDPPQKLPETE